MAAQKVFLEFKDLATDDGTVVYIVVTGYGDVTIDDISPYFKKLDETLDYLRKYRREQRFVMVFDLSQCTSYPKLSLLPFANSLRDKNDDLFETTLICTHILLKGAVDEFFTKVLFMFRPGKKPHYVNKLKSDVYGRVRHVPGTAAVID